MQKNTYMNIHFNSLCTKYTIITIFTVAQDMKTIKKLILLVYFGIFMYQYLQIN